jgi:hypothetical protein
MTAESPKVTAAKMRAENARAQMIETAHQLQNRLSPKTLAHNAWEGAKEKGADLAEGAVDVARTRPYATTGAFAALALFLAREPIMDLATRLSDEMSAKRETKRARKRSAREDTMDHTETVE